MLDHLTTAELLELERMLNVADKNGGWGSRFETMLETGYDRKFAYHLVRVLLEVEEILTDHDLNIDRNSEILKSIRRGDWTLEEIQAWFATKEKSLEQLYSTSTLRHSPDEKAIKTLLMNCLEMHYGTISTMLNVQPEMSNLINDLQGVLEKYS